MLTIPREKTAIIFQHFIILYMNDIINSSQSSYRSVNEQEDDALME